MSTVTSKIGAHVAVGTTRSNQFLLRFVVSSLLTCIDASMLLTFGRFVYRSASISLVLPAAFVILTLGMIASLVHVWILTIRLREHGEAPKEHYAPMQLAVELKVADIPNEGISSSEDWKVECEAARYGGQRP
jgi:hypothetical protein